MRGLAGADSLAARPRRRRALLILAATTAGCAAPSDPSIGAAGDLYVALARARAIAVVDPATDKEVGRISLAPLGESGHPWRLGVSPTGGAAVMSLKAASSIGLVSGGERPGARGAASAPGDKRRCDLIRVDSGRRVPHLGASPETTQALTADGIGRAYVLTGDGAASGPSYAAVVDLETGAVLRHLPLAPPGESVLALQAARDGTRLYASIWRWEDVRGAAPSPGAGRLVAFDTRDGLPLAQWTLLGNAAATDLALAAGPGGRSGVVYASITTPGPSLDEEDGGYSSHAHHELAALDPIRLSVLGMWSLPVRPSATAVTPEGTRAYLLSGSWSGGPWSMRLTSFDLSLGAPTASWPLPMGCLSLALSPAGKLYAADVLGDRLWRVDTRRDAFLGSVPQPGAPLAVATRP